VSTDAEIYAEMVELKRFFHPALRQADENNISSAALLTFYTEMLTMLAYINGNSLDSILEIVKDNYDAAEEKLRAMPSGPSKIVQ
jgi:hypothetical protein